MSSHAYFSQKIADVLLEHQWVLAASKGPLQELPLNAIEELVERMPGTLCSGQKYVVSKVRPVEYNKVSEHVVVAPGFRKLELDWHRGRDLVQRLDVSFEIARDVGIFHLDSDGV